MQIRADYLSVLIWAQTVCSGYQRMTKVTASKERVMVKNVEEMKCPKIVQPVFSKYLKDSHNVLA